MALSKRGEFLAIFENKLHKSLRDFLENPYDEQSNKEEKFHDPANRQILESHTYYSVGLGERSFRQAIATCLTDTMKSFNPISPDDLICLNGSAAVVEALGQVLGNLGDGVLLPAPFYGGFMKDLEYRAGLKIVSADVPFQSDNGSSQPYELTVDILEKAYNGATKKGIKICALLLINPHNPLGYIYSEKQIQDYLHFAHRLGIHVILDELYIMSIFKEGCTMKCVLSHENIPDPERLHVVWALSKDFCVSGFRCGVLHTTNQRVKDSIGNMSEYQSVSPIVQHIFTNILNDLDWVKNVYIPTNHKRLRKHYKIVCDTLKSCGISYVEAVAGFFIWCDLRHLLSNPTHEDEWKLFQYFLSYKVYFLPGLAFASKEPGWFRIIFSQKPNQLEIGMERLKQAVDEYRKQFKQIQVSEDDTNPHESETIGCKLY